MCLHPKRKGGEKTQLFVFRLMPVALSRIHDQQNPGPLVSEAAGSGQLQREELVRDSWEVPTLRKSLHDDKVPQGPLRFCEG